MVRNVLEEARERSEKEARRILTYAMQRYASDCTYERTTASIPLPNDEMKGRIIRAIFFKLWLSPESV